MYYKIPKPRDRGTYHGIVFITHIPMAAKEVDKMDCAAALTLPATASLSRSTITLASFGVNLLARHSTSSELPALTTALEASIAVAAVAAAAVADVAE